MTTAPSCSLPRTHSADLPGDHCRCHRQEAEALWSPRFGPDLMSTERKLPSGLPSTPPTTPAMALSQLSLGMRGDGIRKEPEA